MLKISFLGTGRGVIRKSRKAAPSK